MQKGVRLVDVVNVRGGPGDQSIAEVHTENQ
jgi:hypothetical protein